MKNFLSVLISFCMIFCLFGCTENRVPEPEENKNETPSEEQTPTVPQASEMFSNRDKETDYSLSDSIEIALTGDTATATSDSVKISKNEIVITEEKTHIITGSFNGTLKVDADEKAKLQLVFSGVNIESEDSAALYILNADKVFLTLSDGKENSLSGGEAFKSDGENNIDGVLFSKQDLTINGKGSLSVSSPAGHGIVCKDDLVLSGGRYEITSASHGIDANDSVRITEADIKITAGKDGVHCENDSDPEKGFVFMESGSLNASAEGDGVSAGAYLQLLGGAIDIVAGGGYENGEKEQSDNFGGFGGGMGRPGGKPGTKPGGGMRSTEQEALSTDESATSMKGLKAESGLFVSGGEVTIDSADDAVHSNQSAEITGGTLLLSSGDDGIHAEETLSVSGGSITIKESYEGLEALDIEVSGGETTLSASDDGLNAAGGMDQSGLSGGRDGMFGGHGGMSSGNGSIVISGGKLMITASGDGIDANGTLLISGGHTTVTGPTQGDTATLDYDKTAKITGGTFIGTGASGMAQTFSESEQGVIALSVGQQAAGTEFTLCDKNGKELFCFAPTLSYAVVILSSPELQKGETYTININGTKGDFAAS